MFPVEMQKFSPNAQQVLGALCTEAARLNHNYVGSEHLLLAITAHGQGVTVNALRRMGADLATVRTEIGKHVGRGPETTMVPDFPYTPRIKKALTFALIEAESFHHSYAGTEHLLLGLIREGTGVTARVLSSLGLTGERVRQEILQERGSDYGPPSA